MPPEAPRRDGRAVLVTRPEPDAAETASRLAARGFRSVLCPALAVTQRPLHLPPNWRPQAVLVTSGNALAALPPRLHATPLLAVGDATAARARAAGFWRVSSAGRDAAALAGMVPICCTPDGLPLLLVSGRGQGVALAAALRMRRYRVLRRVTYATRALRRPPPAAAAALAGGEVGWALFYSAASARAFVAFGRALPLAGVRAAALSPAVAAALAPLPWADIRVASRPNQDELLACLN